MEAGTVAGLEALYYSIREMDWAEMNHPSWVIRPVITISVFSSTSMISVP